VSFVRPPFVLAQFTMHSSPPHHPSRPGILSFDAPLKDEEEVLYALLLALADDEVDASVWNDLRTAAIRNNRISQLAAAYESVATGKKLRALPPFVQGELFFQAATFVGDVLGDELGAATYLENALRAMPTHAGAFHRIDEFLTQAEDPKRLADLCVHIATHSPETEQVILLKRAANLYGQAGLDDREIETYQQLVRVAPGDEAWCDALEARFIKAGRYRDLARMLEQTISESSSKGDSGGIRLRAKLIDIFANRLKEPERAMPHVEAVLAIEPTHGEARRVAARLLESKGLAARAAAALAPGATSTNERAHLYGIELENTRGPRRRDVLRRIGILRQDELSDRKGAFEAFEQALNIDPTDDELRARYADLGAEIKGPLEVARTFGRVSTMAKDPAVRSRITAEMGALLLRGGDAKRARTTLAGVLAAPGADLQAVLVAARALVTVYEADKDTKNLTDVLARISEIGADEAERERANERVAELAGEAGDVDRAIAAWRSLVNTPRRSRALAALEPLYEHRGEWEDLSFVLDERAKEQPDQEQGRALVLRRAEILTTKTKDAARAMQAFREMVGTYGPARDIYAVWMPLLESQHQWSELAVALVNDAKLAPAEERTAIFARLGNVYLTRIQDAEAAIDAFRSALEGDPHEPTSRAALDKLVAAGDHRLAAALVLEPFCRSDDDDESLLAVLNVKALLSEAPGLRLAALEEATSIAGTRSHDKALDFVGRGLAEAASSGEDIQPWLDRFDLFASDANRKKRAAILATALGEHEVNSPELSLLAKRTGEERAAAGDVAAALAVFRRALAYEPSSGELIARVDELLREQGTPKERVALYRTALEQNPDPARRQKLLHSIGSIERYELANPSGAIVAYVRALEDDANDRAAFTSLIELYRELGFWDDVLRLLEDRLKRDLPLEEARSIRVELADIAVAHGEPARATEHARRLMDDPELGASELDLIERIASTLGDDDLLRAVLERRIRETVDPNRQMEGFARLAALAEKVRDHGQAIARLRQAIDVAKKIGDEGETIALCDRVRGLDAHDRGATIELVTLHERREEWAKLPALYDVLAAIAESDAERITWLRKLANTFADRLNDLPSGFAASAKAFAIEPENATLLTETQALAIRARCERSWARVVDEIIERQPNLPHASVLDLGLAKARMLAREASMTNEAAAAFRAVLERADDAHFAPAIEGFEAFIHKMDPGAERTANVRWLYALRIERTRPEERARAVFAAAIAEERELSDPKAALDMYRRVIKLDSENLEAVSAATRLLLEEGNVDGAVELLLERRNAAEGDTRNAFDVQIATIDFERRKRGRDAVERVAGVLENAPDDAVAIELAAKLLDDPEAGDAAAEVLERSIDAIPDPALLIDILRRLLAHGERETEARIGRYERLQGRLEDLGRHAEAYEVALDACRELPKNPAFWDRAESLAQKLSSPEPLAKLYEQVLGGDLPKEEAIELGQRAVAFHEEWFEDTNRIVKILQRVLEIDPDDTWAFDRLKLIFDAEERWDDLFALYDRAAQSTDRERRIEVLEEAAQVAKDFANHSKRAIGYFERLLELEPGSARLEAALERLYDREGCYRELVLLLGSRVAALPHEQAQKERARIAGLWLSELSDASSAIIVVEDMLSNQVEGEDLGVDVVDLLERILAAAERTAQVRESIAPPPPGRHDSYAPMAKKRGLVRQRAAALLKERYVVKGHEADLARMLEVELEAIKNKKKRIEHHEQIAELYAGLGDDTRAIEHVIELVLLEPEVPAHRTELEAIAERTGRYDRLAEVLVSAANDTQDDALQVELLMHAGVTMKEKIGDATRAIDLFFRILSVSPIADAMLLRACREVEPLLAQAGRREDRLDVLEKLAMLEEDAGTRMHVLGEAARLATELEKDDRAIWAWQGRLATAPRDPESIDGLVVLFDKAERWRELIDVLDKRARLEGPDARSPNERRTDHVRIARIQSDELAANAEAISSWQEIESLFGQSEESTRALATLYRATSQWNDLAKLLVRAAAHREAGSARAEILHELGDVQRVELKSPADAIASYEKALENDPRNLGSRAGLVAMLEDKERRADVVRVLLTAYNAADDWSLVLDLTEHRLSSAEGTSAQIAILMEAAGIAEMRARDANAAFALVRRALLLDPSNANVLGELFRFAAATQHFRSLADTLAECIKMDTAAPPSQWANGLRFRMGEVLETHLDEPFSALEAFVVVAHATPSDLEAARAVIRVAARTQKWGAAARVLVETTRARQTLERELLNAVEEAATRSSGWDAVTFAIAALIKDGGGLSASLARDLEATVAVWHRDRRGDPDAAEAAYTRALEHDPTNSALLAELAQLQRRARGRPLIDSLLRLSQTTGGDLDLMSEAADVALTSVGDRALSKSILERLLLLAIDRWTNATDAVLVSSGTPAAPSSYVDRAMRELLRIHSDDGNYDDVVTLLVETASLPWDRNVARGLRHEAARIANSKLAASDRATGIYLGLIEDDPHDAQAVDQLIAIYKSGGRKAELLALERRLTDSARTADERLALRLEVAALEDELEDAAQAISTLEKNLAESPRHEKTVDRLATLFTRESMHHELEALFAGQARLAEADGERDLAANLHAKAAEVAELSLGDVPKAIGHLRRVVDLEPRPSALDALARLSTITGDFNGAAGYLDRLRGMAHDAERAIVTLRLADALTAAGRKGDARACLEDEVARDPDADNVRVRLTGIYRQEQAWANLAVLLTDGAAHAPDNATRLLRLREAADLHMSRTGEPERAIPLLEQASDLSPDDNSVKLALADALGAAARFDEARAILRALIDAFGGRRPKERARVHYHLALLDLAVSDRAHALVELDAATRIDPANPAILRTLAELARDDGQLGRAERSYRALLTVLRRQQEPTDDAEVTRSEVMFELSQIARREGEADRANEILESAFELGAKNQVEARRLEAALRKTSDHASLARALELRLARAGYVLGSADLAKVCALDEHMDDAANVFADLGRLYETVLGRVDDALELRLSALTLDPSSTNLQQEARRLASALGKVKVYEERVRAIADIERRPEVARELFVMLARISEVDSNDKAEAASFYERALAVRPDDREVLAALDRVYGESDNHAAQARVLGMRVALDEANGGASSDALFQLAELRFRSNDIDAACDVFEQAFEKDPDADRAEALLRRAADAHPKSERVLAIYERLARADGHERTLIDALVRTWELPGRGADAMREAVEVAQKIDEKLAESLLRKWLEGTHEDREARVWALSLLSTICQSGDRVREAVRLKREAAEIAEPEDARRLFFEVAALAAGALDDLPLAASTYEDLRQRDPADEEVWSPLLDVYRTLEDYPKLTALLGDVVNYVDDAEKRAKLRLERVRIGMEKQGWSDDDAAKELREIVDDDPSTVEAAVLLGTILERSGREADLVDLLAYQLDSAKDRQEGEAVSALSRRLGALLEGRDRGQARDVYYTALDWDPKARDILVALERLHEQDGELDARAEIMERRLALETGNDAEALALTLAEIRTQQGEADASTRALEIGFRSSPQSHALRDRLEALYRERNDSKKLAELYVQDAHSRTDSGEKALRLSEAARIYKDELHDVTRAATALREAHAADPTNFDVFEELVVALAKASEFSEADAELTGALEKLEPNDPTRVGLVVQRASVRARTNNVEGALLDFEQALEAGANEVRSPLAELLGTMAVAARGHGNTVEWREYKLRIFALRVAMGDLKEARNVLIELEKADNKDCATLRALANLDELEGQWEAATATYLRLVELEKGDGIVTAALKLAEVGEKANRLQDARVGLERARTTAPGNIELRQRLAQLYEQLGAWKELAELVIEEARATNDVAARFDGLLRGGQYLLAQAQDPEANAEAFALRAIEPLEQAQTLRPNDLDCAALLSDAYVLAGRIADAEGVLHRAIASFKGRRTRELSVFYHRLARIAEVVGDSTSELAHLTTALDMDAQNGVVASELACLAMESANWDVAQRALRAVTMLKTPGPLSKALAYQHLGEIARTNGDTKRALMLLKRALDEDSTLDSARALLEELSK